MLSDSTRLREAWIEWRFLLRSRWPTCLLIASVVFLAGAWLQSRIPPLHEAGARIAIVPLSEAAPIPGNHLRQAGRNELMRAADEITRFPLLLELATSHSLPIRWGTGNEANLRGTLADRIRVKTLFAESAVEILVRETDPADAATLANDLAARFLASRRAADEAAAARRVENLAEQVSLQQRQLVELEATIRQAEESERPGLRLALVSARHLLHSLEAKHQSAVIEAGNAPPGASLLLPASQDRAPEVRTFWQRIGGLALLGMLAGLAALSVALMLNRGLSRAGGVATLMKAHHLHFAGLAPVAGRSAVNDESLDPEVFEPYREIRNRLLRLPTGECSLLTLLPLQSSEPAAESVANLACVLADSGRTVLVIDANCRTPVLHRYFAAARHPGLTDFLRGEMRLEETVLKARRPNLWFMPSGPGDEDPGGLFVGRRMMDLLQEMRTRFEFVLLSSPPLEGCSEAGLLAGYADFAVLISPFAAHSDRRLREARLALETSDATLAGLMLTTTYPLRLRDQAGRPEPAPLESRNSSK